MPFSFLFYFSNLKKQLKPIERYALGLIEKNERLYREDILRQAEAEIEAQKQEFDLKKIDTLTAEVTDGVSERAETPDKPTSASPLPQYPIVAVRRTRSQIDVPIDLWKLDSNPALRNSQGHYW